MLSPLSQFTQCPVNRNGHGTFKLVDSLLLEEGSMPARRFPIKEDTLVILLEDRDGDLVEMKCYGHAIGQFIDLGRNTVVRVNGFTLMERFENNPPFYERAHPDVIGFIRKIRFMQRFAPQEQPGSQMESTLYTLAEVKSYLGRFNLTLVGIDDFVENEEVGAYQNTHWITADGEDVMITAYRQYIEKLKDFQQKLHKAYTIRNAVPYANSRFAATHFTIESATEIEGNH